MKIRERKKGDTLTDHNSGRNCIPLQPEGNEGAGDEDDAGYEYSCEIEGSISREDQVDLQAAIVTCGENVILIDIS